MFAGSHESLKLNLLCLAFLNPVPESWGQHGTECPAHLSGGRNPALSLDSCGWEPAAFGGRHTGSRKEFCLNSSYPRGQEAALPWPQGRSVHPAGLCSPCTHTASHPGEVKSRARSPHPLHRAVMGDSLHAGSAGAHRTAVGSGGASSRLSTGFPLSPRAPGDTGRTAVSRSHSV